jgi:hypothetical protein
MVFQKPKEMVAFDKGEEMSLSFFRVIIRNIPSEIGMYKVAFLSFFLQLEFEKLHLKTIILINTT